MINGKKVLGLVTARGGSKGLPGKNIRNLRGKPLIGWTIDAARGSRVIDDLVVSTDSEDIAAVARRTGGEVPFLRPTELASDTATSMAVIEHAITWLKNAGRTFEYLVLLEPTSPLRESHDIDNAVEQMLTTGMSAVVSVCRAESVHPVFMYRKTGAGRLEPFLNVAQGAPRRQDIEPVFFLEGTVYASRIDTLLARRSFYHDDTLGYEVPKWKSPEIDDEIDLLTVEAIMRHKGIGTGS